MTVDNQWHGRLNSGYQLGRAAEQWVSAGTSGWVDRPFHVIAGLRDFRWMALWTV